MFAHLTCCSYETKNKSNNKQSKRAERVATKQKQTKQYHNEEYYCNYNNDNDQCMCGWVDNNNKQFIIIIITNTSPSDTTRNITEKKLSNQWFLIVIISSCVDQLLLEKLIVWVGEIVKAKRLYLLFVGLDGLKDFVWSFQY